MNQKTSPYAPVIVAFICAVSTLAIGAGIGFGLELDNISSAKIFRLSLSSRLFSSDGASCSQLGSPLGTPIFGSR